MFGMIRNSLFGGTESCPLQVLRTGAKDDVPYEERVYDAGKYAVVEVTGKPFDEASREAVLQLLKYVGGANQTGAGMGMTAPVTITAFPAEDGSLQQRVKVLLRIPSRFQEDPPVPTESSIQIEERERVTVYSTQFGGYAKEADYVAHAAKLRSALGEEATYQTDYYYCNGYDPPMKPYGRRNEVWLVRKD
ncbi:heme-binding protein 1 [Microcaecilia unicolor]|uniref:Heme-binding protein 1 n=1 Tax=Microcaecilia unicolor TaxID=1415580 RepID=A0A6P7Y1D9_9AMPH|nr:heme-binding protein 1 [Microcaecilia unicolor]